ncbi:MAG: hypothetical protein LAN37_13430 [Acidobacteriia bacterium]|nr:hypothetical protein [Terriglobia bacterium]
MAARFVPTEMKVELSKLSAGDRKALARLVEAARVIDDIFLTQYWAGNHDLYKKLQADRSPLGWARLHYFWINKGPWSELDEFKAFVPGVPAKKLPGANFYPEDMTKEEFEAWVKALPADQNKQAIGFFTVVQRDPETKKPTLWPYNDAYGSDLDRAAMLLREAAELTDNATLKKFLTTRAAAFLSNGYYESDLAWMDLDASIDLTIGPYETYNDELFGYKASFEAFVNLRDDVETEKVQSFSARMQEIENNLPIEDKYKNPRLGALAPIRVVNEVFGAGDGNHGIQTAAYNLPNDEKVTTEKGTKRVMLKNVQEAKFGKILVPIAQRLLVPEAQKDVNFESFFTHILAHEMTHGIGPQQIKVGGRATTARQELKELFGAIEEAKADVTGLFMLQHLMDKQMKGKRTAGGQTSGEERQLYTTYLASAFRSLRFGSSDAHGKGMAVQFNYIFDKGGFVARPDGRYEVDFHKIKDAVRDLDHELLTLEATGDYAGAKKMLTEMGVIRQQTKKVLDKLADLPTDIEPVFVTANQISPPPPGAPTAVPGKAKK